MSHVITRLQLSRVYDDIDMDKDIPAVSFWGFISPLTAVCQADFIFILLTFLLSAVDLSCSEFCITCDFQICQSVWSPQSVDMAIQEIFLPFLRVAALLKYHLFNVEFPSQMVGNHYTDKNHSESLKLEPSNKDLSISFSFNKDWHNWHCQCNF